MKDTNKKIKSKDKKDIEKRKEINSCVEEINSILKKYEYHAYISEWLTLTNKRGSFSFETDENGLLIV
jgi:hypothetical protein